MTSNIQDLSAMTFAASGNDWSDDDEVHDTHGTSDYVRSIRECEREIDDARDLFRDDCYGNDDNIKHAEYVDHDDRTDLGDNPMDSDDDPDADPARSDDLTDTESAYDRQEAAYRRVTCTKKIISEHSFAEPCQVLNVEMLKNHHLGFMLKLTAGEISLRISSAMDCCEHFGALMRINGEPRDNTPEAFESLVGRNVSNITVYKSDRSSQMLDHSVQITVDLFDSDKKPFASFLVFNEHNGYYPHGVGITIFGKHERFDI